MSIERKILQKDDILPTEPYVDYIKFININTRCVGSHNILLSQLGDVTYFRLESVESQMVLNV